MARLLRMPEVAASAADAVLQQWAVDDGAVITDGQTIATVETEKAVVDVEADGPGTILKVITPSGSTVDVGAPIAVIADPGEEIDDLDRVLTELGVAATDNATAPEPLTVAEPEPKPSDGRVFASPLARKIAREANVDVVVLDGSGPGGRIVRRDVERAITQQEPGPLAPISAPAPPAPTPGGYDDEPHTRMRTAIAVRVTESKRDTPHFYLRASLRVDRLLALRAELNEGAELRISVNDLVVKAVAHAHTRVPAMNAIWTPDAIRHFRTVDVAVAVDTPDGLVAPILHGVDHMSIAEVARTTKDLVYRARSKRLAQSELEGGSCTVTNLGMHGTEEFTAIINPPQSSILAVGAALPEPVVEDGAVRPATVMRVTLSVDHRAVDGALAAEWTRTFAGILEHPVQILA
ncbi:MAG: 2-oxo acid dehydrogenase subunit E2 [Actinomycetia bacterium]|nr:2-oxo acid dehydrogenase subunit E2 [Actinomycetes bacterium]